MWLTVHFICSAITYRAPRRALCNPGCWTWILVHKEQGRYRKSKTETQGTKDGLRGPPNLGSSQRMKCVPGFQREGQLLAAMHLAHFPHPGLPSLPRTKNPTVVFQPWFSHLSGGQRAQRLSDVVQARHLGSSSRSTILTVTRWLLCLRHHVCLPGRRKR